MTKNSNRFLFLLITAVSSLPLISSDIYLPAFPQIGKDFAASNLDVQLTLSIYLLGLAITQIIYGPLSDHFGRKRVLGWGLIIYSISTLSCAFSPTLQSLIIFRFFQAVGACSGLVIGRAIVGDLYKLEEAAKMLSLVYPIVALSPAIAPIFGGYMTKILTWRVLFFILSCVGAVLFFFVKFKLYESKPEAKAAMRPKEVLSSFKEMLLTPKFLAYSTAISCAYGAYFAYLSGAPFLFDLLGKKSDETGFLYAPVALSYIFSTLLGRKLLKKIKLDDLIFLGCVIFSIGSVLMFSLALFGSFKVESLYIPMTIVTLGNGFILSFSMAGAINLFRSKAGTASGLVGTLQLTGASVSASIVGVLMQKFSVLPFQAASAPMALWICFVTLFALFVFSFLKNSHA